MSYLSDISTYQFMPHGHCFLWNPIILWLNVISDSLIALSYYAIPLSLMYLVGRRRDIPFSWMFVWFALFIFGCGTTHILEVVTVWNPLYFTAGIVKLITAFFSIITAILLIRVVPHTLALPTTSLLANLNAELRNRIDAHRKTETELRHAQSTLEKLLAEMEGRVQDRTRELEQVNLVLHKEVATRTQAEARARALNDALLQKAKILETLYDVVPIGLGIAEDPECRTISANSTLKQLLGLQRSTNIPVSEAVMPESESFHVLKNGEPIEARELPMQSAAREGRVIRDFEEEIVQHNGEKRSLLAYAAPIKDDSDLITGCVGVFVDITERKKMEETLRKLVVQQEALLREVHHRVKNNLQVISSMFSLQINYVNDPRAKEVFRESQERLRSMALIHEGFYKSGKFGTINLQDYVGALVASLRHTMGRSSQVKIELDLPSVELSLDGAVPLGLIVNELLSNSFKYAFSGRPTGIIEISARLESSLLKLIIRDNGVGSEQAVAISKAESFGLRIIRTLVRQLDGAIETVSDNGVKNIITLPLKRLSQQTTSFNGESLVQTMNGHRLHEGEVFNSAGSAGDITDDSI